jgi:hypothetical protein
LTDEPRDLDPKSAVAKERKRLLELQDPELHPFVSKVNAERERQDAIRSKAEADPESRLPMHVRRSLKEQRKRGSFLSVSK